MSGIIKLRWTFEDGSYLDEWIDAAYMELSIVDTCVRDSFDGCVSAEILEYHP